MTDMKFQKYVLKPCKVDAFYFTRDTGIELLKSFLRTVSYQEGSATITTERTPNGKCYASFRNEFGISFTVFAGQYIVHDIDVAGDYSMVDAKKFEKYMVPEDAANDTMVIAGSTTININKNNIRSLYIYRAASAQEEYEMFNYIHEQLASNQDYIGGNIILNRSKDRNDGTENELHYIVFEDSISNPDITI